MIFTLTPLRSSPPTPAATEPAQGVGLPRSALELLPDPAAIIRLPLRSGSRALPVRYPVLTGGTARYPSPGLKAKGFPRKSDASMIVAIYRGDGVHYEPLCCLENDAEPCPTWRVESAKVRTSTRHLFGCRPPAVR